MATQKHTFSNLSPTPIPSPPSRERLLISSESRERTQALSLSTSSTNTVFTNGYITNTTGSDGNLTRFNTSTGSMREQLLRRLHKGYRQNDRTGSLSPPLHRSFRSKRTLRVYNDGPDECIECQKLEESQFNLSVLEVKMRRSKLDGKHSANSTTGSTSISTTPLSTLAFPKKSYSIETETPTNAITIGGKAATSYMNSTETLTTKTNGFTHLLRRLKKTQAPTPPINNSKSIEYRGNGDAMRDNLLNGNASDSSYVVEINESHLNMSSAAESNAISDQLSLTNSDESNGTQSTEMDKMIADKSLTQWMNTSNDRNNNENFKVTMDTSSVTSTSSFCLDNNKNVNGVYSNGVHEVHYMNTAAAHSANESIVRIKSPPESLDSNTIDTIISRILVDSLKNIIGGRSRSTSNDLDTYEVVNEMSSQMPSIQNANDSKDLSHESVNPLPAISHEAYSEAISEVASKSSLSTLSSLSNSTISVIGGSAYPNVGNEAVIQRHEMPRTDSLEVQPSSSSSSNKEPMPNKETRFDDDDDLDSLVDSLDDPLAEPSDLDVTVIEKKPTDEKSQVFFVPLESTIEIVANVSKLMPEKLLERLVKRQAKMTERKEAENKRRQENIEKIIQEYDFKDSNRRNSMSFKLMPFKPNKSKKTVERRVSTKKAIDSKQLRSGIGELESYRIDGHGNLQWSDDGQSVKTNKPTYRRLIKRIITTTKKPTERSSDTSISSKSSTEKRSKPTSLQQRSRTKLSDADKSQESLKRELVQRPVLEQMTPDPERGPRRMYQKTQIHEGAKCIEILEIVECMNGTPDFTQPSSPKSLSLHEKYSKIPVPTSKSRSRIGFERRLSEDSIGDASDLMKSNDVTGDKPKLTTNTSAEALNNAKRIRLGTRRNNAVAARTVGNGKRSAHNSAKYQQIFDVIPEEKCVGQSTDSAQGELLRSDTNEMKTCGSTPSIKSNGKAAIESDQGGSADAWYDCFGRAHIDSDSVFMETGNFHNGQVFN